ncbi:hypothetical protein K438DRAFT_1941797 [Mycena galopus ATCC 62051]|nr:hypothetical protein K438DRAFT_1941797 [Mycena galopus ATCC 62051]
MPRHCYVLQVIYCSPLQTSTAALPSPLPFTLHQSNAATSASIGAGVDEHAFYPSHIRQSQVRSPSRSKRLIMNCKHPRHVCHLASHPRRNSFFALLPAQLDFQMLSQLRLGSPRLLWWIPCSFLFPFRSLKPPMASVFPLAIVKKQSILFTGWFQFTVFTKSASQVAAISKSVSLWFVRSLPSKLNPQPYLLWNASRPWNVFPLNVKPRSDRAIQPDLNCTEFDHNPGENSTVFENSVEIRGLCRRSQVFGLRQVFEVFRETGNQSHGRPGKLDKQSGIQRGEASDGDRWADERQHSEGGNLHTLRTDDREKLTKRAILESLLVNTDAAAARDCHSKEAGHVNVAG